MRRAGASITWITEHLIKDSKDYKIVGHIFRNIRVLPDYDDLWIATDPENANSVYVALKEFGAPLANLTTDDFTHPDYFYLN